VYDTGVSCRERADGNSTADPLGPLHREPDHLLAEERPSAMLLRPLLDAIGAGAHRVSEIAGRIGQPATSLGRALVRLTELGLVTRDSPFGEPPRSTKRALYRIADPFFRLWFRVVAPRRGELAQLPPAARRGIWRQAQPGLVAEAWEELCRASVPLLGERSEVPVGGGPWGAAARFWAGRGPQWDVVARSLDGAALLLGEVKWHNRAAEARDLDAAYHALLARGVPPVSGPPPSRVVHAVFVPKCAPSARRRSTPYVVVEAGDVLAALV
jgi:hypothetical protein